LHEALKKNTGTIDIHHAGTAMRFLTAYYAALPGSEVVLTGSKRMTERPVKLLVDALKKMGADISYVDNEGFPPLVIRGKELQEKKVSLSANISSQYISALMMIAPSLPEGLEIELIGQVTSVPYIIMTLDLLKLLGIKGSFSNNKIFINNQTSVEPK